jgi:hypothetical protein
MWVGKDVVEVAEDETRVWSMEYGIWSMEYDVSNYALKPWEKTLNQISN